MADSSCRFNVTQKNLDRGRSLPYAKDPHYFKKVYITALAAMKMAVHAHSGGDIEIMGMCLGYVEEEAIVILDSFAAPVEGTETRVNAHDQAYEYISQYFESVSHLGHREHVVGWYHSHPGYGCWLSGIDVQTQKLQQMQGPFVAIVVDPKKTSCSGRLEIGAFRTLPPSQSSGSGTASSSLLSASSSSSTAIMSSKAQRTNMSIPSAKVQDFGVHAHEYYSLEILMIKSAADTAAFDVLFESAWAHTLSSSAVESDETSVSDHWHDVAEKTARTEPAARKPAPGNSSSSGLLSSLSSETNSMVVSDIGLLRSAAGAAAKRPRSTNWSSAAISSASQGPSSMGGEQSTGRATSSELQSSSGTGLHQRLSQLDILSADYLQLAVESVMSLVEDGRKRRGVQ